MSKLMRTVGLTVPLAGLLALCLSAGAQTLDEGWVSNGPNCAPTRDVASIDQVWLGHFSGGNSLRNGQDTSALDWHDEDVCFASRKACNAWLGQMRKTYRVVEGWTTCLPIR